MSLDVDDAAFYNRATGELETVADMRDEMRTEDRLTRIEEKVDTILDTIGKVERLVSDVIVQIKPTLDELMNSQLIKMLGIGKKK